jgi:hypothetical protein
MRNASSGQDEAKSWGVSVLSLSRFSIFATAILSVVPAASAMQWSTSGSGLGMVILAEGETVPGDDQQLRDLVAQMNQNVKGIVQRAEEFRLSPVIEFNSPGGNLFAGLQLGLAIQELGLRTRVPASNICFSACTYAFLGGTDRRVAGRFGVHAVSTTEQTIAPGALDDIQEISAILIAYTRDMVGVSNMAEAGLQVRAAEIYELSDAELRDWKVITHVSRPSQRIESASGPLSRCDDDAWRQEIIPHDVICADLTVGRNYLDIVDAVDALRRRVDGAALDQEQARFDAYWQSCETAWMSQLKAPQQIRPAVEGCMREAFNARATELASLLKFHETGESEPARSGWKAQAN